MKTKAIGLIASFLMVLSVTALAAPPSHVCDKMPDHPQCASLVDGASPSTTSTTAVPSATTSTTQARSTTTTTTTTSTTTTTVPTTTTTTTPQSCSGVNVTPSTDLQTAINNASAGETFCFAAGTYFIPAPLRPKSDQNFISTIPRSAILTGNDNTNMAFNGDGSTDVLVQGFIIERFNVTQTPGWGALKGATGWSMIDNEVRNNNGLGIYHGAYSLVKGNTVHHNAHSGLGGYMAHYSVIEENEVYENGANGLSDNTGSKWSKAIGIVFRNNYYHHNHNNAVWFDGDNLDILIEDNVITDNYGKGIQYEISCAGTIRNNTVERNGTVGIMVVASQDLSVYGNTVADNRWDFDIWNQVREGSWTNCEWRLENVKIFDNDITISREQTRIRHCCGGGTDVYDYDTTRIQFDNNRYIIDSVALPFEHDWQKKTADQWVSGGQDQNSSFFFTEGSTSFSTGVAPE